MAKRPAANRQPAAEPAATAADRAPTRSLEVAVALEHAQAAVGMPTPPEIQAVLDKDPEATEAARAALKAQIEAAEAAAQAAAPNTETMPASSAEPQE